MPYIVIIPVIRGLGEGLYSIGDQSVAFGRVNASSAIKLVEVRGGLARFNLLPQTGKTHQLRIHMSGIGFAILNDSYYPELLVESADNFAAPLQLLAKKLCFKDPLSGRNREFSSARELLW